MSGAIHIDMSEVERLNGKLADFARLDRAALLDVAGGVVEAQTVRRISHEKTAPDGTPWPAWSPAYAETRTAGQSLLQSDNNLVNSIDHFVNGGDSVEIGSPLVYAAIHQWGGEPGMAPGPAAIPQREYLGISDANEPELQSAVLHFLQRHAEATLQ